MFATTKNWRPGLSAVAMVLMIGASLTACGRADAHGQPAPAVLLARLGDPRGASDALPASVDWSTSGVDPASVRALSAQPRDWIGVGRSLDGVRICVLGALGDGPGLHASATCAEPSEFVRRGLVLLTSSDSVGDTAAVVVPDGYAHAVAAVRAKRETTARGYAVVNVDSANLLVWRKPMGTAPTGGPGPTRDLRAGVHLDLASDAGGTASLQVDA